MTTVLTADDVIDQLQLEAHVEGGYYRRTFASKATLKTDSGSRHAMSSIFYLLTKDQPLGCWHKNRSDILHYHQLGSAIRYHLLYPNGELHTLILGNNLKAGEQLQFLAPGGVWKATELLPHSDYDFGLLSEAVCPGFDFADMTLGDKTTLSHEFPQHKDLVNRFCHHGS